MKVYDISAEFSDNLPFYPGDPKFERKEYCQIQNGDKVNVSQITFGTHTGTHIDAPKHFIDDGKTLLDFSIEKFLGNALVIECVGTSKIDIEHLQVIEEKLEGVFLLLKTDNRNRMLDSIFDDKFIYLTNQAAQWLVEKNIKGIGIDYLTVEAMSGEENKVHEILLNKEILILEGLVLSEVPVGKYQLIALPLKIPNSNGSPTRAVLIET